MLVRQPLFNDTHSREDADSRKRLRGMPEVVKTHLKKYTKNTGIA